MNALWIDEGTEPNYPKLGQFRELYFSHRDPLVTRALLEDVRAHGFACGIYWADSWNPELDGAQAAELVNASWLRLNGPNRSLAVQFDAEQHNPQYIVDLLTRWRQLRPNARTSWTLEAFQGGWVKDIRAQVLAANVLLVPQAYEGDMSPYDPAGAIKDLTDYGFPYSRIEPFHDAARLTRGWYGFAFTQARLP